MKESHHSNGLRTLEDISAIILHSHDLHETLENIVTIVARRMGTDVCSIYLLEKDGETLVLKASKGLSKASVNRVSMKVHEGLTGLTFESRGMVMTDNAPAHPRYKYFKESKEEKFLSFLGLPLFERKTPIGVIVIQTREARNFSEDEISTLRTITFQISSIVHNAGLLDSIQRTEQERAWFEQELAKIKNGDTISVPEMKKGDKKPSFVPRMLSGSAVSAGFCRGKVYILDRFSDKVIKVAKVGTKSDEKRNFSLALEKVKIETIYMEKRVSETLSEDDAAIFHTHLMILEDRGFSTKVGDLIDQGTGATRAVHDVVHHYVQAFSAMEDPYLRERSADMEDIGRRLIDVLEGNDKTTVTLKEKRVLIAEEIFPSDLAMLDHEKILGIVTENGNIYSHAAIMAKSMGIPSVFGVAGLTEAANVKDEIIVDGTSGHVYINPDGVIKKEYERLERDRAGRQKELEGLRELPAVTRDNVIITLNANIGLISDVRVANAHGAQGVGLYRTEFPYMTRTTFPDRHQQAAVYRKILEAFSGQKVNIRTLDIGGDKGLPYFSYPHEDNPFLGWRSIRVSLERQDIFREQLAGILLSATAGFPTIMFPLISSVDEIRQVKKILTSVREELKQEGHELPTNIPLGIMIEVPAAVLIIDHLLKEVDYVSIGTNDLIQYTLAADRNNPRIKQYYDPYHPAVLYSIKQVADAAAKAGKEASVCGEMAAEPINALLMIGMGIREFSLSAPSIPAVKQAIRSHNITECRTLARQILACASSADVKDRLGKARKRLLS
ncbi:phosphoenolpyruvate--protein phosphotransferase [Geobacter sp. AOG2]|uniref:phosphoenolpyruvate--protein phosphotransferase n=1 Tax=Geobacter sp. AOG2 TaxID=1566347 RepID=UPI001CC7BC57|nr:phosphoenolpyruvate--protein phosphotransferase [Geobacter sp. AOG2]GFE61384.1 phosphoenolpyruvate-protein phosphotransferase [Geobacter sp. AOG2]